MSSTVIRKSGEFAGTRACRWCAGIVTLVCALFSSTPLRAQITIDGSLGPRQTLTGPNFTIGADLGQIRGRNLFHSFGQFNVRTGEVVSPPCMVPVKTYPTVVQGGEVFIEVQSN